MKTVTTGKKIVYTVTNTPISCTIRQLCASPYRLYAGLGWDVGIGKVTTCQVANETFFKSTQTKDELESRNR